MNGRRHKCPRRPPHRLLTVLAVALSVSMSARTYAADLDQERHARVPRSPYQPPEVVELRNALSFADYVILYRLEPGATIEKVIVRGRRTSLDPGDTNTPVSAGEARPLYPPVAATNLVASPPEDGYAINGITEAPITDGAIHERERFGGAAHDEPVPPLVRLHILDQVRVLAEAARDATLSADYGPER